MSEELNQNINSNQEQNQPSYLTKESLLEVITPLLSSIKEEANKGVNAVDKRANQEIAALKATIESLKTTKPESTTTPSGEEEAPAPTQGKLTAAAVKKEAEDKINSVKSELQSVVDALKAELEAERQAGKAKERKAFEKGLTAEGLKKLTANGFEDVSDAMEIFFVVYKPENFLEEDGNILYRPSEDADPETYDSLIDKFKNSSKGKRFLPAAESPKGAGLPKQTSTTTTQKAEKTAKQTLEETVQGLNSGKLKLGV